MTHDIVPAPVRHSKPLRKRNTPWTIAELHAGCDEVQAASHDGMPFSLDGVASPCLLWKWRRNNTGYGVVFHGKRHEMTHRLAWRLANGAPPLERPFVLHKCDQRACCRVDHLFVGTNADNVADREAKGRGNQPHGDAHGWRTRPDRIPRGERNRHAKLTEAAVREIRLLHAGGLSSLRNLALKFGIDKSSICRIIRRETWAHV